MYDELLSSIYVEVLLEDVTEVQTQNDAMLMLMFAASGCNRHSHNDTDGNSLFNRLRIWVMNFVHQNPIRQRMKVSSLHLHQ